MHLYKSKFNFIFKSLKTPSNENHVFLPCSHVHVAFLSCYRTNQEKVSNQRLLWVFLPSDCSDPITDSSARFETRVASLRNQFLTDPAPDGAGHCGYKSLPLMRRRRRRRENTPVLFWVVKQEEKNLQAFIFYQRTWKSESNGWISFPKIIVVQWKFQIKRQGFAVTISRRTASPTLPKKDRFCHNAQIEACCCAINPSWLHFKPTCQSTWTIPVSLFLLPCNNEMQQSLL